jgi:hypothetical protein
VIRLTDLFEQNEGGFDWETMTDSSAEPEPETPTPPDPEDVVEPEVPAEVADALAAATADDTEVETEDRQRDAQGRFLPKFKDPDVNGFLEKYNGNVEEALKAAVNSQSLIGSQGGELGQLRQQLEALQTQVTRQAEPAIDYDTLLEENPARATMLAWGRGDNYAYQQAVQQWEAVSPGSPAIWAQNLQLQQQLSSLSTRFEETTAPLKQQAATQGFANAYQELAVELPELNQLGPDMGKALGALGDTTQRAILSTLETGTQESQKEVLRTLYHVAKGLRSDTLAQQGQDAAKAHVEETQRAKDDAILASASASHTETPQTNSERIGNEWASIVEPLESGWHIGG